MHRLSSATHGGARTPLHPPPSHHSGASAQGVHQARTRAHALSRNDDVSAAAPVRKGGGMVVRGGGGLGAHKSLRSSPLPPGVSLPRGRGPPPLSARCLSSTCSHHANREARPRPTAESAAEAGGRLRRYVEQRQPLLVRRIHGADDARRVEAERLATEPQRPPLRVGADDGA